MNRYFWPIYLLIVSATLVWSQPPVTPPSLSTADRTALSADEQRKQDAQKAFNDAQQNEIAILREWQSAHPGFHLNQQTFAVEADVKAETPKSAEPAKKP